MGVSYYCMAGYGVKIDLKKIKLPEHIEQSCEHPERAGQKFCPVCGKKVETRRVTDQDILWKITEYFQELSLPKGYMFVHFDYEKPVYFLGWGKNVDVDELEGHFWKLADIPSATNILNTVEGLIDTMKVEDGFEDLPVLFDPDTFGFYIQGIAN